MADGYARQHAAAMATGEVIYASHLNDEFNDILSAFHATTGHDHSAGTGLGPLINLNGGSIGVTGTLAVANGGTGSTTASAARTALGLAIGTDVQAYDAGLLSIAGLTTAADKMIYTTASDTYATADLTSFARTILDDANATTALATLGIVLGTSDTNVPQLAAAGGNPIGKSIMFLSSGTDTIAAGQTRYMGTCELSATNAGRFTYKIYMKHTVRNLYVKVDTAPGTGETITVTLTNTGGGVGDVLEATVSGTSTEAHDTSSTPAALVSQSAFEMKVVSSVSAATTGLSVHYILEAVP